MELEEKMTNDLSAPHLNAEAARMAEVYARRTDRARYSWFSPGQLYLVHELQWRMLALVRRHGWAETLANKQILEIGCGRGFWLRQFIEWGARPENVSGIDLLPEHVAEAKRLCPAAVRIELGNATELQVPDASLDLIVQITVFTSILDPKIKEQIAREMLRAVKPEGLILWLDFHMNNPRNPDVRGVKKREIHELFPGCQISLQRVLLAPPLFRAIAPFSMLACHLLGKVPLLCTHYLGSIRKR
jgi:SAM-dependent methyltransferase